MKQGLFGETGNVECDLLSFARNKQFSATSPELPEFEQKGTKSSTAKRRSSICEGRPSTALSFQRNRGPKARESRCHSAYEPLWEDNAIVVNKSLSADDSRKLRYFLHSSKPSRIVSVPPSIQEASEHMHASKAASILPRSPKEAQGEENHTKAKPQLNLHPEGKSPPVTRIRFCLDRSLDEHDDDKAQKNPKPRQSLRKDRTKNHKKNVRWKNSVIPLPTGSDFDNLIRSGAIAKHIAKKERRQR